MAYFNSNLHTDCTCLKPEWQRCIQQWIICANWCNFSAATLTHTFWSCLRLSGYWSSIFDALSKIFKRPINPNPLTAIFGIQCQGNHLPGAQSNCIAFVTLLARRIILLNCSYLIAGCPALLQTLAYYSS